MGRTEGIKRSGKAKEDADLDGGEADYTNERSRRDDAGGLSCLPLSSRPIKCAFEEIADDASLCR